MSKELARETELDERCFGQRDHRLICWAIFIRDTWLGEDELHRPNHSRRSSLAHGNEASAHIGSDTMSRPDPATRSSNGSIPPAFQAATDSDSDAAADVGQPTEKPDPVEQALAAMPEFTFHVPPGVSLLNSTTDMTKLLAPFAEEQSSRKEAAEIRRKLAAMPGPSERAIGSSIMTEEMLERMAEDVEPRQ